jgi:integrase
VSNPRQIPFAEWPAADQAAWDDLFVEGDMLDGVGPARNWAPATRRTNLKHYAQWLGWLEKHGMRLPLAHGQHPWQRATLETVTAYGRSLRAGRSPSTVASALIGLKCVLIRMAPDHDWQWLRDLTNRLKTWARRTTPRPTLISLSLPAVFETCLGRLEDLRGKSCLGPSERTAYRNTLIIALLAVCPIRLRNLAMIEIGTHLLEIGEEWWLVFDAHETKTGETLRYPVHADLVPHLVWYIPHIRPQYRGADETARLWMGLKQAPMSHEAIYDAVTSTSKSLLGTRLSPHEFRSLAATFLSEASASDSLHARALLGHRSPSTTQDHYIRASSIEASRKIASSMRAVRDGGPRHSGVPRSTKDRKQGLISNRTT